MATKKKNDETVSSHSIVYIEATQLNPAPYNPRKITPAKLNALKNSLKNYGWLENIVVQKDTLTVIGGHQRLKAYIELCKEQNKKPSTVPCVVLDVGDRIAKKLNIALNRLTGEFDSKRLGELLNDINQEFKLVQSEILDMGMTSDEIKGFIDMTIPDIEPDSGIKEFAKSVTFSIPFDSVERRDYVKKKLTERATLENKLIGDLIYELLTLCCLYVTLHTMVLALYR